MRSTSGGFASYFSSYFFCVLPEVPEPAVEFEVDPVVFVLEFALAEFMASNTDIPCGPMVMTTGLPSFVFA